VPPPKPWHRKRHTVAALKMSCGGSSERLIKLARRAYGPATGA
jgi:hypothetical protein